MIIYMSLINPLTVEELLNVLPDIDMAAFALTCSTFMDMVLFLSKRCDGCKSKDIMCVKLKCGMSKQYGCELDHTVCRSEGFKLNVTGPDILDSNGIKNNGQMVHLVGCNLNGYCGHCGEFRCIWSGETGISFNRPTCCICSTDDICDKCVNKCSAPTCTRIICDACIHTCQKCKGQFCTLCYFTRGRLTDNTHNCYAIQISFEDMEGPFKGVKFAL